jgi:hypothetical protein
MNTLIVSFLVFGALFGLATYSNRHLFSEGSTSRSDHGERGPMDGRAMWVAISCFLWPILMLTGLFSAWHRSRAKAGVRVTRGVDDLKR